MPTAQPEWTMVDFVHRGPWFRHSGILLLNIFLILPLLTAWSNGLDSSLVNGLQLLPAWEKYFNNPSGKLLGLLNSSQNIGSLLCLPFAPFMADRMGRRATIFLGSCIMLGGVAMQTSARSIELFIGARVMLGFGLTFCLTGSPLLITELAYPTQRGRLSGFYNSCWYFGSIANAWTVYAVYSEMEGIWTWKIPTLIQAFAPIMQVLLIWFIPESPRWLVSRGLESQAAAVLARFHAHGDTRDPLVIFELAQIRHALRSEKEMASKQPFSVLWGTPGNRKRIRIIIAIALFSQWSGNGLISYYCNLVFESVGITETRTKAALNGGLQIWNLCCAMTGAFLVEKLGRRTLFLISNTGMLIVFCIWTITVALYNDAGIKVAGKATVPFIFIFYFFYDLAYTPLLIAYSLEILPFHIRAKGFTLLNLTVALTIAFNQFVNPWALEAIGWWYYLVYVGFLVFELFFVWRYIIETKGRTLEETAALFDGEPVDLVEVGGEAATTASVFHPVDVSSRSDPEKPPSPTERDPKQSSRFENIEMASLADSDYSGFEVREDMRQKRTFDDL